MNQLIKSLTHFLLCFETLGDCLANNLAQLNACARLEKIESSA